MKMRNSLACLVAAVACVSTASMVHAVDLTWDANGSGDPVAADGSGNWDLTNDTWHDGVSNVVWTNGSNATFGNLASSYIGTATPNNIDLAAAITVGNLVAGTAADGAGYNFSAFGGGSLTLNGNITKASGGGVVNFLLGSPLTLSAGNHTFTIRDTPGDAAEITMNSVIAGTGNVVLNNQFFESWGTLGFTQANTYTGTTSISKGRLVITDSQGLGATSGNTTISGSGTLGLGGGGLAPGGSMNIAEPIVITRSDYSSAADFTNFGSAIYNVAGNNTISGPITLSTTDARFRIDGGDSNLTISSNLVSAGKVSIAGGGPGSIEFTGNNTGLAGGFNIRGGSMTVSNQASLGGASSTITFGDEAANPGGGGYLKIMNDFMTDFGTHNVNFGTFSGGIDVQGTVFNLSQNLGSEGTPAGQLNKRGPGVLNVSGTNVMNGRQFIDFGTVNIIAGSSTGVGGLGVRNGTLNIEAGATYTVRNNQYSSIAIDSGENGTVNVHGSLIAGNADFNVSDLGGSTGTLNIFPGAVVETQGINFIAKNTGSLGTVNQTGGELRVLRGGDFAFVLGDGRFGRTNVQGVYNLSGGTFTSAGEVFVGEGGGAIGAWNQTGGTATINNWFVIGRESGSGDVDISGGSIVKAGNGNTPIGEGTNARGNTFTIRGTGLFDAQTGEVWVSNGNNVTTMNIRDSGTLNVNSYFVVGRFGDSKGTLNISDNGTINKAGANPFILAPGGGSTGTLNQTGGTINNPTTETWISDGGVGVWNISAGTINAGLFDVGHNGGGAGTFNVSGTAAVTATTIRIGEAGTVSGTLNFDGGTISAGTVIARNSTGAKTFNFNGGTLAAGAFSVGTGLTNTGTGKVSPGLAAVGATAITGTYTQGATASMAIGLGGSTAGAFDTVTSSGAVTLDGRLDLSLLASYTPTILVPHVVITGSSVAGKFSTIGGVGYTAGRGLAVTYSPTTVTVTAARLGDTNLDGTVNFDDLLKLAQNYGSTSSSWATGDFDGTGTTVFDDLLALAQNYGLSGLTSLTDLSGSGVSSTFASDWALALSMVPEPSSLTVLGLAGTALLRRSRQR